MSKIVDFLGSEIKEGVRGVRVHSTRNTKDFKKVTVVKLDISRQYGDSVGIITDGNSKVGWTYPDRIIVQESIKVKL